MKAVLCGNYSQFLGWCFDNKVSKHRYVYIYNKHQLIGRWKEDVILGFFYWKNEAYDYYLTMRSKKDESIQNKKAN